MEIGNVIIKNECLLKKIFFRVSKSVILILFFGLLVSCGKGGVEGDIENGIEIARKMEFALQLAKDQNPNYEIKMNDAEQEIYDFLTDMREKHSDEDYKKIDNAIQKEIDRIMRNAMSGY